VTLRSCTVTILDLNEVAHSLDVTAATLYEAIAQALAALRGHEWVSEIGKGLTTVSVKVRQPEVTHIVKIQDFENWLSRRGKTPAEILLKARLNQLLGTRED
jgi:LysM repeat protein